MKNSIYYIGLLLLVLEIAQGQPNCFHAVGYSPSASQVRICVGRPITMTDVACTSFAPDPTRLYKFYPTMTATPSKTHTYTQPGTYTVELIGNVPAPGTGNISTIRHDYVVVLPTPKPKIRLTRCANRQVKIEILEFSPYDRYKVDLGNSVTQFITPSTNPFIYNYPTAGNYTIKIEGEHALLNLTNDYCSGVNADTTLTNVLIYDNLSALASNFSVVQEGLASACEGKIKITLPQIFADIRYEVYFAKQGQNSILLGTFENQNQQNVTFTQENLNTLGQSHTIVVRLQDKCGNQYDFTQVLLPAISNFPLEVRKVNASFDLENNLQITWQATNQTPEELRTYQVYEESRVIEQTTSTQISLSGRDKQNTCYTIGFKTNCGVQTLFSKPTCPIILRISASSFKERTLQWNVYQNSDNESVLVYHVLKYSANGNLIDSFSAGTSTSYTDSKEDLENQVILYRIKALTSSGEYFSNVVRVERPAQIFFPNAFTPNSDGLNDTFFPKGVFIRNFQMSIFTPNGQRIFQSTALSEGWDGTFQGKPMPQGTYIFQCIIEDFTGKTFQQSGTLLLQR
ncbi:MAG: gliding motility-associated C-terminal domain-containing protein [Raineya sp.]|nr:gliding motility-associated C-terminal domain-containing protein [Raineya sp.]MDW8295600.1 gliding motility-associated C-terminal domain-containing protein [Raineya sp.]